MRVQSIAVCLVLLGSASAMAQETAVGVKAGVNSSNLHFEEEEANRAFDRRTGFVGGLFVVSPANGPVALQLEALFSQRGVEIAEGGVSGQLQLDYVDIPVLLRVSAPRSGRASFHVFGGPSLALRVRANATADVPGQTSVDMDLDDELARFDFGVVAGAGIDVGRVTIDGRHTWGISNVNKDDEVKVRNRVFAVMVGVRF